MNVSLRGVSSPVPSDEVTLIFRWLFFSVICLSIDTFGVVTNIINIICFIKQGFNDPVNVSLLGNVPQGLAVADMGCVVTLVWTNICVNPSFDTLDLPFDAAEFQYLTGTMSHSIFTRITGWLTALITLERCLCITVPLKVKHVVTSRRVSTIVAITFILLIFSSSPVYVVNKLGMKYFPLKNKTIIGLIFTGDVKKVESVSFGINNVSIPFISFMLVIICTTILVVKLKSSTQWRNTSTVATQSDKVTNRNQRVSKMVVMISSLFISCFFPVSILYIVMSLVPGFSLNGKHRNWLYLTGGLGLILESINSSGNIFFYYNMSSKYKTTFFQLFGITSKKLLHASD